MRAGSASKEDILLILLFLDKGRRSRKALSRLLSVSEGVVREELDLLKKSKLVRSDRGGHFLSEKGISLFEKSLSGSRACFKVSIKGEAIISKGKSASLFGRGNKMCFLRIADTIGAIELRDIAIRNGASGAITIITDGEKGFKLKDSGIAVRLHAGRKQGDCLSDAINLSEGEAGVFFYGREERSVVRSCAAALLIAGKLDKAFEDIARGLIAGEQP